jgi:hypothetical protein
VPARSGAVLEGTGISSDNEKAMEAPHAQALIDAALPYWEAEGEIAKRFFASKPNAEDQIFWLKAQVWKELHPVDGYFNGIHRELSRLTDLFPKVDIAIDRHEFGFALRQIVEEFEHYVLFADVLQMLTGAPVGPSETVQLPAEKALGDTRRRLVSGGNPIDAAAVLFTEGGGARLFREGAKVTGGPLEAKIAHAMGVIYDDERDHFREAALQASAVIANDADLARIVGGIVEVSAARVEMRREMFRNAMTPMEIDAFIARLKADVAAGRFSADA